MSRRSERIRTVYRVFGPFVKPYRGRIALAYIALAAATLMTLARPWPLKLILDSVLLKNKTLSGSIPILPPQVDQWDAHLLIGLLCGALIFIAILESLFGYFQKVLFSSVGQSATTDVLEHVFTHLQTLPRTRAGQRTGDTIVRLTSDIKTLRDLLINHVQKLASYAFTFFSTLAVMAWMNWELTALSFAVIPFIFYASYSFSQQIRRATKRKRSKEGEVASIVEENLQSAAVVQAFVQEQQERERFRREARESLDAGLESARLGGAFTRLIKVLNTAGMAAVVYLGAVKVIDGSLSPGDLVVFAAYIAEVYTPIQNVSELAVQFMESLVSGERVLELLQTAPRIRDSAHASKAPPFRGEVRFENVVFGYEPGARVLDNISLHVNAGETVAFVGGSGSGKSTIVNLLLRFFDPWEGRILIDGHDIRHFKLNSLRSQISVVLQESILFRRTVRENIAYGKPGAFQEEVVAAAKAARAHEFIEKLPDGYQTMLDEDGSNFSGGQRRRIALARAFLRNSPVLILDEPTSGLDATTEAQLTAAVDQLVQEKTAIVIAHRFSTIGNADRIFVLDHGRIVEQGTHQQLLDLQGKYRELYEAQIRQENTSAPQPA